jgi:hypothetical protein
MTKSAFYDSAILEVTHWWLHECDLPLLRWARLRCFSNGTADVTWDEGGRLYGFLTQTFAEYFLAEDEYILIERLDQTDGEEFGIDLSSITPPNWADVDDQHFEYIGSY